MIAPDGRPPPLTVPQPHIPLFTIGTCPSAQFGVDNEPSMLRSCPAITNPSPREKPKANIRTIYCGDPFTFPTRTPSANKRL